MRQIETKLDASASAQREAAPKLYFLSPLRCGPLCNRYLTFHAMKSEIASIQKKIAKDLTITFRLVANNLSV